MSKAAEATTTPAERVRETFRRILRQTTLRAILRPLGKTPLDVNEREAAELLEPYQVAIDADFLMCTEVSDQLIALALSGGDAVREQVEQQADEDLSLNTEA